MAHRTIHVTKEQIEKAIAEYHPYLSKAAKSLDISYDTFRRRAKEFGLYKPSRSFNRKRVDKALIEQCINLTEGMPEAAKISGLSYASFKRHAIAYGVWKPAIAANKGKKRYRPRTSAKDILEGKHPTMSGGAVKRILIECGHFKLECSICHITEWRGQPAPLQMDHIDGNCQDHRGHNIRLLCPNCHAQTPTFMGKNKFYKNAARKLYCSS